MPTQDPTIPVTPDVQVDPVTPVDDTVTGSSDDSLQEMIVPTQDGARFEISRSQSGGVVVQPYRNQ